jgi:hypothetical protein
MDVSEEYIKMCEKATEIQEQWKPKAGDYASNPQEDWGIVVYPAEVKKESETWLPRQDQLQDMFTDRVAPHFEMRILCVWIEELGIAYYGQFKTHEQYWLVYVMYVLHNKVWNGEDWVSA